MHIHYVIKFAIFRFKLHEYVNCNVIYRIQFVSVHSGQTDRYIYKPMNGSFNFMIYKHVIISCYICSYALSHAQIGMYNILYLIMHNISVIAFVNLLNKNLSIIFLSN